MENKNMIVDVISKSFPRFKITKKLRDNIKSHPLSYQNCDVRIRLGLFYTEKEWEKKRDKILSKKLP